MKGVDTRFKSSHGQEYKTYVLNGYVVFRNRDPRQQDIVIHFKDHYVTQSTVRKAITKAVRREQGKLFRNPGPRAPFNYKDTLVVTEVPLPSDTQFKTDKHGRLLVETPFGWRVQDE